MLNAFCLIRSGIGKYHIFRKCHRFVTSCKCKNDYYDMSRSEIALNKKVMLWIKKLTVSGQTLIRLVISVILVNKSVTLI